MSLSECHGRDGGQPGPRAEPTAARREELRRAAAFTACSRVPGVDQELLDALERIANEADRAAETLRRIRNFVQKTAPNVVTRSLNDLVREAVTIINLELKRTRGRIVCQLSADTLPVRVDPIQIEQVLVNLARNGLESMSDLPEKQRVLHVGTRRFDERTLEAFVCDHGKGISGEEMSHVFQPFFTTKADGMGMGLAISRSIVQSLLKDPSGDTERRPRLYLPLYPPFCYGTMSRSGRKKEPVLRWRTRSSRRPEPTAPNRRHVRSAGELLFLAIPDKHAGDVRRQLDAAAASGRRRRGQGQ